MFAALTTASTANVVISPWITRIRIFILRYNLRGMKRDNPAMPNGIIYEGVERYGTEGQAFRGQTGSQSSI